MSDNESDLSDFSDDDDIFQELMAKRMAEMKINVSKNKERKQQAVKRIVAPPPGIDVFISGPSKLVVLKNKNQVIRLFGEWHGFKDNCSDQVSIRGKNIVTIMQYLDAILDGGGVDLYIEAPLLHLQSNKAIKAFYEHRELMEIHNQQPPYLVLARDQLKWCLNPADRKKCRYKNSRIHSTDIRPFHVYADMTRAMQFKMTRPEWEAFRKKYAKLMNSLASIKNCKDYVGYILSLPRRSIIKQIEKSGIRGNDLRQAIFVACKKRQAVEYVKGLVSIFSSPDPPIAASFSQEMTDLMQEQITILHDVYTFLRMIKPMNKQVQRNVVFYGGQAHVDNLEEMLKVVGFRIIPNNSERVAQRCLKLDS